jgi:AraC-like DNA-binding protein
LIEISRVEVLVFHQEIGRCAGHYRVRARAARQTSIEATYTTTSTRDNFSTMTLIEEALAAIESREPGDDLIYQEYADWFGVSRSTLSRRQRGCQATREAKIFDQTKLTPQQEEELVVRG